MPGTLRLGDDEHEHSRVTRIADMSVALARSMIATAEVDELLRLAEAVASGDTRTADAPGVERRVADRRLHSLIVDALSGADTLRVRNEERADIVRAIDGRSEEPELPAVVADAAGAHVQHPNGIQGSLTAPPPEDGRTPRRALRITADVVAFASLAGALVCWVLR